MNSVVKEIRGKLRALREHCIAEAMNLRAQLAEAEKELEQVDTALAAIGEKPSRDNPRRRSSIKPRLPCATKDEVLAVIHETLAANGSVPAEDLKDLAGEKLREQGKSLSMFATLFAKCLQDPSLQSTPEGAYSFADMAKQKSHAKGRKVGF